MEPQLDPNFLQLLTEQLRGTSRLSFNTRDLTDEKRLDYLNGDQFKNGQYWNGPGWDNDPNILAEITKMFVCNNQIKVCIGRHVSAILGKDPEFDLLSGTTTLEGDLVTTITEWWKKHAVHKHLKNLLLNVCGVGKASLRVYIPSKHEDTLRQNPPTNIQQALQFIRFQLLTPLEAGPVIDEFDDTLGYYYQYTVKDGRRTSRRVEVHTPEQVTTYEVVGGKPSSVIIEPRENPVRSRGDFLIREFSRDDGPMIDQSTIDLQNALNEELTYMRKDSQLAGFRSVYTVNAAAPIDPETKKATPWRFSPKTVLAINGLPIKDDSTGKTSYTTPEVGTLQPVKPDEIFIPKARHYKEELKGLFNQGWVADESPSVSGESQIQSREAFNLMVTIDSGVASAALAWLVETTLTVASWLSRQALPEALTCRPKLYLSVPQGNLEQFLNLLDAYKQGLASLETVLEANPAVTDPVAEAERIRSGINQNIELAISFLQAGGSVAVAMEMLRNAGVTVITPEMIQRQQEAEQGNTPEPDPQDPSESEADPENPA